ncbi:MAG: ribose 5-phosphate isomerase B [Desulfuromonas sp.]|nr:MAG: ribose 5-phosphate isomerase B [Desulfuromonas sp.]
MLHIASDHGGLELKEFIRQHLLDRSVEVKDCGTINTDSVDYPDFGEKVAGAVSDGSADLGVLICGTGIGMSIVANKFPGVRAALAHDKFTAQMAKEHNNANVLVLGGRILTAAEAEVLIDTWLDSAFEAGRHQRRLDKIAELEQRLCKAKS